MLDENKNITISNNNGNDNDNDKKLDKMLINNNIHRQQQQQQQQQVEEMVNNLPSSSSSSSPPQTNRCCSTTTTTNIISDEHQTTNNIDYYYYYFHFNRIMQNFFKMKNDNDDDDHHHHHYLKDVFVEDCRRHYHHHYDDNNNNGNNGEQGAILNPSSIFSHHVIIQQQQQQQSLNHRLYGFGHGGDGGENSLSPSPPVSTSTSTYPWNHQHQHYYYYTTLLHYFQQNYQDISRRYRQQQQQRLLNSNNQQQSGWTPVITTTSSTTINSNKNGNQNQPATILSYQAINPSSSSMQQKPSVSSSAMGSESASSNIVAKVVPLVATNFNNNNVDQQQQQQNSINISSQYLASESISRNSYQTPHNAYMIHPTKYKQAFFPAESIRTEYNKSVKNLPIHSTHSKRKSSSSSKGNKIIDSVVMPIPMIKPHKHGATLGFNLPEQGLTLYLDINELATKPMAQNIGLKVVAHQKNQQSNQDDDDDIDDGDDGEVDDDNVDHDGSFEKQENSNRFSNNNNLTSAITGRRIVNPDGPKKIIVKKAKFRYQMAINDSAIARKPYKVVAKKANNGQLLSPMQAKFSQQQNSTVNINNNFSTMNDRYKNRTANIPPSASRIPITYSSLKNDQYQVDLGNSNNNNNNKNDHAIQQKLINDFNDMNMGKNSQKNEREIITFSDDNDGDDDDSDDSDNNGSDIMFPLNFDNHYDTNDDDDDSNEQMLHATTQLPIETTTTTTFWSLRNPKDTNSYLNEPNDLVTNGNTLEEKVRKQEMIDNELVQQMQLLLEKSTKLIEMSADSCLAKNQQCHSPQDFCTTGTNSIISNTSTTIREIAQQLDAHHILNEVSSLFESELQDFMDFSTKGYTIILPSNNAVKRLPPNLLKRWHKNMETFMLNGYLIEGIHTIDSLSKNMMITTRGKTKLIINRPFNETYTINGQRVIRANQQTSNNGLIHVIDGLLYPGSNKDIIDTLKSCGRFDGFVTLVEGTGFADLLRKEGPFTVFVPSNDALQKVPDTDLEVIRRNMTALKEFLMYHVAQGAYYSQDLRDGQFMPSILNEQYLQAGVRVDGCSRRLVEVNVSPLYRSDIAASNGVIHVIDWILKPDDRDWCDGIILPKRR
ncbi:hypothetical protein DERP_011545 [Dermatophagoides pteronyssinus]|uniref:FAS1 domain-containing protein n=2 Tax=Pyroglyphidae TaxID=6952 RepID=A0ABQ8JCP2_DERPT|nr:hypothetical protein DERP_011545 [Dermatophagoides pteronyssinus]